MFSTTTIPLSTSIPRASTKENNTMVFRVTPKAFRIRKDIIIESGMATPTNNAFLSPKKNSSTKTTSITPKIILISRLDTCSLVASLWSLVIVMFRDSGKYSFLASAKISPIASDASKRFFPDLLVTSSITTG